MRKSLLFCAAMGLIAPALVQAAEPTILTEFYTTKMSPDGSVILSQTDGENVIYNVKTGESKPFEFFYYGTGNCTTPDGNIIVGSTEMDQPVVMVNGEMLDLSAYSADYGFLSFNAITPNASRIVGLVSNPDMSTETTQVPIYVDINKDGTPGEIKYLPCPKKDWSGRDPQYITASYISNDGKTILGQVRDYTGQCSYPILFKEGTDGEWSYSLPTESLINPQKRTLPEDPGEFTGKYVSYEDYMTPEELEAYNAAVAEWYQTFEGDMPNLGDYMTPAEAAAYNEAVDAYNQEAKEYNNKIAAFYDELYAIIDESVFFLQNGFAMDAEGKLIALAADILNLETYESIYPTYTIDLTTGEINKVNDLGDGSWPLARQVLSDGTIIASTPMPSFFAERQIPPFTYVLLPGSNDYITIQDHLNTFAPAAVTWLKDNFTKEVLIGADYDYDTWEETPIYETYLMTGLTCVSDDWKVISGGVLAYTYSFDNTYESYVIQTEGSGVNEINADASVQSVKYYDLNGIEVKNPSNGIYVVRTTYTDGTVTTAKTVKK